MNRLQYLLDTLCPNGVPYKSLEECCTLEKGKTPIQKAIPGEYPLVVTTEERKTANTFQFGKPTVCIPLVSSRGHGVASLNAVYYQEGEFALGNILCGVTPLEDSGLTAKFLYYYLNLKKDTLIVPLMKGGANVSLTVNSLKKVSVPIPPVEVQVEIIRLIDKFTDLIDTLQAELQARKKQYESYASKLFTETDADWIAMDELASFVYGYTDKAQDSGDARFIRITDIDEQGHLKENDAKFITLNSDAKKSILSEGDLVMARTGATYGKTLYFESPYPSVYASFLIKITPDNRRLLNKYYWHFTKTTLYWAQANKLVTTGGQPQFNTPAIKQVKIPVPSIDEQQTIINTLDKLDKLCNDLSTGLPAEISARQKQYEYYRDKLLTFKPLAGSAAAELS